MLAVCRFLLLAALLAPSQLLAEPVSELFDACDRGQGVPEAAAGVLLAGQWSDISSEDAYRAFMQDTLIIIARAKLSAASYPEPWTDATVGKSYPTTIATDLAEVRMHIDRNVAADDFLHAVQHPGAGWRQIVLAHRESRSRIVFVPGQCWMVGMREENPAIVDVFLEVRRRADKGSRLNRWFYDGRFVGIGVLSPHARSPDPRFPTDYNFILAFSPRG